MFKKRNIDWNKKILNIVPLYGLVPLLLTPAFNMLIYFGTKPITYLMKSHDVTIFVDNYIPQIQWWMIIYVLAYVVWIVGFILLAREEKDVCFEIFAAENLAKIICFIVFMAYPTTMAVPELKGSGFVRWLSDLVYFLDDSYNNPSHLLPSIHCLESWILFRAALRSKIRNYKYGYIFVIYSFTAAVAICASTVFVKQHVILDVIAGILVVEFGLFMSKKFKLSRFYYKLEDMISASKKA